MPPPAEFVELTTYEKAIATLESSEVEPDPDAPSCLDYRLRPSEVAAILQERLANPPPPWGKKISLSKAFLGPEKCLALGSKLILNRTVTYLDLSMCDLQESRAAEFFACVQKNKVLRHLNLTGNSIGDSGAVAAAPCVLQLETLHLGSNEITDVGALAIADALRASTKIKALNVRSNRITQFGIYKLLMSLEEISPQLPTDLLTSLKAKETPAATANVGTASEGGSVCETVTSGRVSVSDGHRGSRRSAQLTGVLPADEPAKREEGIVDSSRQSLTSAQASSPPMEQLGSDSIVEEKEAVYNETLNVLWIENNVFTPPEMHTILTAILAKRFPPPPPKTKKKKGGKPTQASKKK